MRRAINMLTAYKSHSYFHIYLKWFFYMCKYLESLVSYDYSAFLYEGILFLLIFIPTSVIDSNRSDSKPIDEIEDKR